MDLNARRFDQTIYTEINEVDLLRLSHHFGFWLLPELEISAYALADFSRTSSHSLRANLGVIGSLHFFDASNTTLPNSANTIFLLAMINFYQGMPLLAN